MQLRLPKIFLLFIALTNWNNIVLAQAKFTAIITPATIGTDETAELKLIVRNADKVQLMKPPGLKNFILVGEPMREIGVETIAGAYTSITYLLKPKAKGNYTIAPATILADGKSWQSNAVKIKVVSGRKGNSANSNSPFSGLMPLEEPEEETTYKDFILKKGDSIPDKINRNIFIKVETNKTSCFVGEPLVVTYKLYTRLKSVSHMTKPPAFSGFSVIDLLPLGEDKYVVEKFNGRDYNMYILRRAQLYPLQAGTVELEAASVENNIHFVKQEYLDKYNPAIDLQNDFVPGTLPAEAVVDEKIILDSKPMLVNVKALPVDKKKPPSFNGAVGNFTINADVEKNYFTTDDAGKLKITISGAGNLTLINAPELLWPSGIEAFEPSIKDELNKLSVPVSGNKVFEYTFAVIKNGSYTLPAVEYSFFDPVTSQYKTVSTKPININVSKGTGKQPVISVAENTGSREIFSETIFTKRWLIIVPVALLIFFGLVFWLRVDGKKQQQSAAAKKIAEENNEIKQLPVENPLAKTEMMLLSNNAVGFYTTLNKELRIFLAAKLQLAPETMNKKNIAEGLDRLGVSVGMSMVIQDLLDEISLQLYTPLTDETRLRDCYEKAIGAIHAFDKNRN